MDRRKFIAGGAAAFGVVGIGTAAVLPERVSAKASVKVYEYTFLKSFEADPAKLIEFIKLNWFAMDKIAVEKGLMVDYAVYESPGETEAWNVAVAVGYPTEKGYEAITAEFEAIRKAHKKILVDGKDLKDLGKITGSRKLLPRG